MEGATIIRVKGCGVWGNCCGGAGICLYLLQIYSKWKATSVSVNNLSFFFSRLSWHNLE